MADTTALNKSKRLPRLLPILADESEQLAIIARWEKEDRDQLVQLADDLGIENDSNRWFQLALALALKHEPSFQEKTQRAKWSTHTRALLVVEIERLTGDKRLTGKRQSNPSHTATWAAGVLAKRPEWAAFLHGRMDPAEALRVQYSKMHREKWARAYRDAFRWHQHSDTVAEWDTDLRVVLARE
jgi:hypothetical protein